MIDIKRVSMQYGSVKALDAVSFSVQKGEILGLLGPNGAGKSTLMKILTTFIYPSSGTATIGGFDILEQALPCREITGYLPENVPLYMDMRVDEYLAFVGNARGIYGNALRERFDWLRNACGLIPVWKHTILELSKGYRQRVGLAQALIHDPSVLILDEPTSGLDPVQIIGIRDLIKHLAREKTIIFSTHILQEVDVMADRIVIINEGTIVAQGTKAELIQQASRHRSYLLTVQATRQEAEKALSGLTHAQSVTFRESSDDGLVSFAIHGASATQTLWQDVDALNRRQGWPVKTFMEKPVTLEEMFIAFLNKQLSSAGQGKEGA